MELHELEKLRIFLDNFPPDKRARVANLFFSAVRAGITDIQQILDYVRVRAKGRYADVPAAMLSNRSEAEDFAYYVLGRESLPAEIRKAYKESRSEHFRREYMKTLPPTRKQLNYLRKLGCDQEVINRWEASELIRQRTSNAG